jgi:ceramide glucosyltransferase
VALALGILAALSFALYVWQFALGMRLRLNHKPSATTFPPVTVLKPLRGFDSETEGCLRTWLEQDYPGPVQVLFGVASEDDPAVQMVRARLKSDVVICPEKLGPNAKVSTLAQLEPLIYYDLILVSDADVAVPKDFLRAVAGFFEAQRPSLASCLYKLSGATNLPMRLEEFAVNSDFWSQVLQSIALKPMKFALGASMIINRESLAKLGGFRAIVEYLADDFQLGNRVEGKVALCPIVVESRSSPMRWRDVWAHQVRWARTIRVCQPVAFFFSIVGNPTLWPAAWAIASGAWLPGCALITIRAIGGALLERKLTGRFRVSWVVLAPLSDILRAVFWLLAFAGNQIHWAGRDFRVSNGGKLTPEKTGG